MSKVQLQGNVSGTGVFTIASPNSNTDRTLTLPDQTGTLLSSSAQGIPKAALPTGSVLQVVSTYDATAVTGTANEYDVLTTSITPTSATSKILLLAQVSYFSNVDHCGLYLKRNSTDIARATGATYVNSTVSASFDNNNYGSNPNASYGANPIMYLDSPATTSATTYKVVLKLSQTNTANWFYNRGADSTAQRSTSSLILMEIAA